jgi:hypothetical protein
LRQANARLRRSIAPDPNSRLNFLAEKIQFFAEKINFLAEKNNFPGGKSASSRPKALLSWLETRRINRENALLQGILS